MALAEGRSGRALSATALLMLLAGALLLAPTATEDLLPGCRRQRQESEKFRVPCCGDSTVSLQVISACNDFYAPQDVAASAETRRRSRGALPVLHDCFPFKAFAAHSTTVQRARRMCSSQPAIQRLGKRRGVSATTSSVF